MKTKRFKKPAALLLAMALTTGSCMSVFAADTSISMGGTDTTKTTTDIPVTADVTENNPDWNSMINYTVTAPATIPLSMASNKKTYESAQYNVIVKGLFKNVTVSCASTDVTDSGDTLTLSLKDGTAKSTGGKFYLDATAGADTHTTSVTLATQADYDAAISDTGAVMYGKVYGVNKLTYGTWEGGVKFTVTKNN